MLFSLWALLKEHSPNFDLKAKELFVNLSARLFQLKHQTELNIISNDEAGIERNKIIKALTSLVETIFEGKD